ncbi:hypothetical protein [Streptomyces sp. NRRL S-87]|uniref:hypothetical protein n=1 Tax=Streptomyces sp. NRRL S-87 TaxID=1463920 RepID=UPI0004C2A516|nr:hypothetical protein [Streptomyces sp. NRRL S-87]
MITVLPWEAKARGGAGTAALRAAAAGRPLHAVRYLAPPGGHWPDGHRDTGAHETDSLVELVFDDGSALLLFWEMDGLDEGLAAAFREAGEPAGGAGGDGVPVDVTAHPDWAPYVGRAVSGLVPAWHVPDEGCPEQPWAYRLEFTGGLDLVVALGEAEGGGFTYMPDALVVLFDRATAAAYRIPASGTSAYG